MINFGYIIAILLVMEIITGIYNKIHSSDDYPVISGSSSFEETVETVEETVETVEEKEDIIKTPKTAEEPKNVNYEPIKIIIYRHGSVGITQYGEVVMLN